MISASYFLTKIKDVKIKDILSIFPMTIAFLISPLFKNKYRNTWLICEEPSEARDNGYVFFKYLCKNTNQKCVYAIKKNSVDHKKVQNIGPLVRHGSVKHWIIYFTCRYNISSQKGGKPNAAICSFFELNNVFKTQNVFLQHGVIINNLEWLHADRSRFKYFVTSTTDETKYIKKNFGYPDSTIIETGLPRFDLYHSKIRKNVILIMPTWRSWFNLKSKQEKGLECDFSKSEYFHKWKDFLEDPTLNKIITNNKLQIVFYIHRNLQKYSHLFKDLNTKATIASWKEYDIQKLLIESRAMVTDYSSVFYDMVYMKKPVIFYQFDKEKFRKYQYSAGYFNYDNNKFGKTYEKQREAISALKDTIDKRYSVNDEYITEHKKQFRLYDTNNCKRIYNILSEKNEK